VGLTEIVRRTNLQNVGGIDPQISQITTEGDGSIAFSYEASRAARRQPNTLTPSETTLRMELGSSLTELGHQRALLLTESVGICAICGRKCGDDFAVFRWFD
jgi:hypothetical protein